MKEIGYKVGHTDIMAKDLAAIFEAELGNQGYSLHNTYIELEVEFYRLQKDLSIQLSYFEPMEPLMVKRQGTDHTDMLILDFHMAEPAQLQVLDDELGSQINGLFHGAYFASAGVESSATFSPSSVNRQFHVVINKSWITDFLSLDFSLFYDTLDESSNFFIYEPNNTEIMALLISIFNSDQNMKYRKSFLHGKTLELVSLFFQNLQDRRTQLESVGSNYDDISRIIELMDFINKNLGENLNVRFLAEKVGFSESKLQKLCKAIYGKSISKEIMERRMISALELLATKRSTISEVGYKMGYTNMSHFSRAFKNVHGFLPSLCSKN